MFNVRHNILQSGKGLLSPARPSFIACQILWQWWWQHLHVRCERV